MSKMSMRRMFVAAAAGPSSSAAAAAALVSSLASASAVSVSSSSSSSSRPILLDPTSGLNDSLSTSFSCGLRWSIAKSCSDPCPTGDDDACPDGERCYAGVTCDAPSLDDGANDRISASFDRASRGMELEGIRRIVESSGGGGFVDAAAGHCEYRFVCGTSHADAGVRCAPSAGGGGGGGGGSWITALRPIYCDGGGQSPSSCPAGTECYASVPCPRVVPPRDDDDGATGAGSSSSSSSPGTAPTAVDGVGNSSTISWSRDVGDDVDRALDPSTSSSSSSSSSWGAYFRESYSSTLGYGWN